MTNVFVLTNQNISIVPTEVTEVRPDLRIRMRAETPTDSYELKEFLEMASLETEWKWGTPDVHAIVYRGDGSVAAHMIVTAGGLVKVAMWRDKLCVSREIIFHPMRSGPTEPYFLRAAVNFADDPDAVHYHEAGEFVLLLCRTEGFDRLWHIAQQITVLYTRDQELTKHRQALMSAETQIPVIKSQMTTARSMLYVLSGIGGEADPS